MPAKRVDHIGLAVRSADDVAALYARTLGLETKIVEVITQQGVKAIFLGPEGDQSATLELLEPLAEATPVGKFLAQRGEAVHHVCFEVADVAAELRALESQGVTLIDKEPRPGEGRLVAFVHPKSMHGVLVELVQYTEQGH